MNAGPIRRGLAALFFFALLLPCLASSSQPTAKRLILKDGSYQIVTRYEIKGDRVRYISAERGGDWEEVPYALVDWGATNLWNQQHAPKAEPAAGNSADAGSQEDAAAVDREEAKERADEAARVPRVAPGLNLPDESGVFVLDNFHNQPELIRLQQSTGDLNRDSGHSVLRAMINPMGGAKEPIRIDGAAAKVQLHIADPVLYVSLDVLNDTAAASALPVNTHGASSQPDKDSYSSPESRYAIVRVMSHRNLRALDAYQISLLGKVSTTPDIIPTSSEILPGKRWMKLTPKQPLGFGEYALIEMLSPQEINLDVWDFGVNPRAPENKDPLTPLQSAP